MNKKLMGKAALILVICLAITIGTMTATPVAAKPAVRKPVQVGLRESAQSLESDIASYISTKGATHNFAEDKDFLSLVNELGKALLKPESEYFLENANHFAVGDLDGDKLPEIAVYEQRDSENMDDPGALVVYQFKDGKYQKVASNDMEYDNTCIKMVIGTAAPGQNALFVQTAVGAHSEMFYLFLLKDGKLQPAIDDSNARLLSAYTSGDIADIDKDGIVEFSIYVEDPEGKGTCIADSDKISYWYKWNGKDSVKFVKHEQHRNNPEEQPSDPAVMAELTAKLESKDLLSARKYLQANLSKITKKDASDALETYVGKLKQMIPTYDAQMQVWQENSLQDPKNDILIKYGLTMSDLNSMKRLQEVDFRQEDEDLKKLLVEAGQVGLEVKTVEAIYFFGVDYNNLLTDFKDEITNELTNWFQILASYYNKPALEDGELVISFDELTKRIVAMEEFQFTFPYSHHSNELTRMHENHLSTYLYGANNTPSYDYETRAVKPEALAHFEQTKDNAIGYPLCNLVNSYLAELKASENKVTPELQKVMTAKIKELVGGIYVDTKTITSKTDIVEVDAKLPVLPGKSDLIGKINAEIEQTARKAQAEIEAGAAEAKKAGSQILPHSLTSSYRVPYNQDNLLSVVCESYQYTGGAHGMPYKTVYNVDTQGERLLTLKDFFPERQDYLQYIKGEIKKAIQAQPEYYFEDAIETVDTWEEELSFYAEDENVVVFFHPYDIACYAAGFREFKIPWDVLP